MILTIDQQDAVTELVNIAFSRTAAALSDLTNDRVELNVPEVAAYPIDQLQSALSKYVTGDVATIHQVFGGPVSGDAFMLLDVIGATKLVQLLAKADVPTEHLGTSDREVLAEIGNILLNASLGVFGELLQVRFTFAVPRMQLESLGSMIASLTIGNQEIRHALLVGARFVIRSSDVTGCLVLVLGVTSLQRFITEVDAWAKRMGGEDDHG